MKLVITYQNYEPVINNNEQQYVSLEDLSHIDDASCDEIVVGEALDYINQRPEAIGVIVNKLRYGGTAKFAGNDFYSLGLGLHRDELDETQFNQTVYSGKQSCSTLKNMSDALVSMGLEITYMTNNGVKFDIEARRPEFKKGE